jgi:hypothetical protein
MAIPHACGLAGDFDLNGTAKAPAFMDLKGHGNTPFLITDQSAKVAG